MHLKISIFADVSDTTDSGKFIWDTVKDANPNHICPVIAICREGSLDQIQTAVSSEIIDDLLFSPLEVSVLKRRIKASIHPDKEYMEDTGMARVTKDTTIGEVIQIDAGVIPILMGAGMHCVGCPSSAGETLEEAAMVHGIDSDMLVEEIQSYLQSLG